MLCDKECGAARLCAVTGFQLRLGILLKRSRSMYACMGTLQESHRSSAEKPGNPVDEEHACMHGNLAGK